MVIGSLALAFILQSATGNAVDYFPLDPGDRWVYTRDKDGAMDEVTYTVEKPDKVGKVLASPLLMEESGRSTTLYYVAEPDTVWLLGVDRDNPYSRPHAVLKVGGTWNGDYMDRDPVNVDNSAKSLGKKNVLGQTREVLEVTTKLTFGNTKEKLVILQHAEYAKGLGLIRFEMEQKLDRNKQHMLLTLKSFDSGTKEK